MRVPNLNKIKKLSNADLSKEYVVEKIEDYIEPYRVEYEFDDEKSKVKFVKKAERLIRSSYEYGEFVKFLRQELDMTHCSYFNNISNVNTPGIKIEIHHEPFSLFDLVYVILSKELAEENRINMIKICEQVMRLHFEGAVGLIPLSTTVHQLVHKKQIFIPINFVFGNVQKFYDDYEAFMTDEQKEVIKQNVKLSDMMENSPELLKTRFVYLEIDGMEFPRFIQN